MRSREIHRYRERKRETERDRERDSEKQRETQIQREKERQTFVLVISRLYDVQVHVIFTYEFGRKDAPSFGPT